MLRGWRRLLLTRAAKAGRLGTRYLHLSSPEKLSVYDHRFSPSPARPGGALADAPAGADPAPLKHRAAGWVDALTPLSAARRGGAVLPHRHALDRGGHLRRLPGRLRGLRRGADRRPPGDAAGPRRHPRDGSRREAAVSGRRDLDDPGDPPEPRVAEEGRLYALAEAHPELALHTGVRVRFRNADPAADPRSVLLSSARPIRATGLWAHQHARRDLPAGDFVWSAEVDWALVERLRPAILLTESAERYMARLPDDEAFDAGATRTRRSLGSPPSIRDSRSLSRFRRSGDRSARICAKTRTCGERWPANASQLYRR